jgi:hypothetical protein
MIGIVCAAPLDTLKVLIRPGAGNIDVLLVKNDIKGVWKLKVLFNALTENDRADLSLATM